MLRGKGTGLGLPSYGATAPATMVRGMAIRARRCSSRAAC